MSSLDRVRKLCTNEKLESEMKAAASPPKKKANPASSLPSTFGKGDRVSGAQVLSYNGALETIFFALFHPASTLSGSLRSPPSPRGEGFASG